MRKDPTIQEISAGPVNSFIETLDAPGLETELPPCPDWPDLN